MGASIAVLFLPLGIEAFFLLCDLVQRLIPPSILVCIFVSLLLVIIFPIFIYNTNFSKVSMVQLERSLAFSKYKLPTSWKPYESSTILFVIGLLIISILSGVWSHSLKIGTNNSPNNGIIQGNQSEINNNFAGLGGWFTENHGQVENSDVKIVFAESGYSIGFVQSGYLLNIKGNDYQTTIVQVNFKGANSVKPEGREELPHRSNYFVGNDSSKWVRDIRNYQKVVYENICDGIDLVYYLNSVDVCTTSQ